MMKRIYTMITAFVLVFTTLLQVPVQAAKPGKYIWKESAAPNYVVKIGKAKVYSKPRKGVIEYSKLDKYGRTRRAVGNMTYKMVKESAGWREEFADDAMRSVMDSTSRMQESLKETQSSITDLH